MLKGLKFFGGFFLFLLLVFASLYIYDMKLGNSDGLIRGYAFRNIFQLIFAVTGVLFILVMGFVSRIRFIQNLALAGASALFALLLLEAVSFVILKTGILGKVAYTPITRFYFDDEMLSGRHPTNGDYDVLSGRWRKPNAVWKRVSCAGDSLEQHTNQFGAYDVERQTTNPNPNKKRVVLLGDSFFEGYMVRRENRLSSLLEDTTGHEHLNFALNSTSPINYYLTYKSIAKRFDHDIVLIGLLPANDFEDYVEAKRAELVDSPIYRPYWGGKYPNYSLNYSLSSINQSISRVKDSPELLRTIDSVYSQLSLKEKIKVDILDHSSLMRVIGLLGGKLHRPDPTFTWFSNPAPERLHYMEYTLERLFTETKGKKVFLLSLPTRDDLKAFRNGATNTLDPALATLCRKYGVEFVPMTPAFSRYAGGADRLFVPCDGHWSNEGERYVRDVLLGNATYRQALQSQNP